MNVEAIFEEFTKKRIVVLGDVMIDAYLRGKVTRVSPEAPVPIIELSKSEDRLGGAANVALNLLALGATPILCAIIGEDDGGTKFNELLNKRALSSKGIVQSSQRKTTIKTRVIGNNQHLLRIDDEDVKAINSNQENAIIQRVEELIKDGIDAIIMEDYNKGLLTPRVIAEVISLANKNEVIVTVDPKKENFFEFKNVTLFKPNLKELKEGLNCDFDFPDDKTAFEKAIDQLESKLNNKISFVTLSEDGVFIKQENQKDYLPAHIRNISDVSGAGDTVISVATLCLTAGLSLKHIAEIANLSGGLVCEHSGVVPIDRELLISEVKKIV
ncbi:MAG TPA: D-glycero-beta-D-manno-heptose-7-phosphate kinase [Crocinitomicaceae bacterium]|nr:D-glycero-beta-D-manno-heptose-7-phosphate kinase [Crocinitomicaceae bacterium]